MDKTHTNHHDYTPNNDYTILNRKLIHPDLQNQKLETGLILKRFVKVLSEVEQKTGSEYKKVPRSTQ